MIKGPFEIVILGALHRKNLTCEISYNEEILAEITQESNELMLEIFPPFSKKYWEIPLVAFQEALEEAKHFLLEDQQ